MAKETAEGRGLVFVSCGQRSTDEKELGERVCRLVNSRPALEAYFAEHEQTLASLTPNILERLDKALALIVIMHRRENTAVSGNAAQHRASVFIEQEVAVAAYMKHVLRRDITVRAYIERGVVLEGMRQHLQLNPISFETSDEVERDLSAYISTWDALRLQPTGPVDLELVLQRGVHRAPGGGRLEDRLSVFLLGVGTVSVDRFTLFVEMPRGFVDGPRNHTSFDELRSNPKVDVFRFTEKYRPGGIRPGDRLQPFIFEVSSENLPPGDYVAKANIHVDGHPAVVRTVSLT